MGDGSSITNVDYNAGYKHDQGWVPDSRVVTVGPLAGQSAGPARAPILGLSPAKLADLKLVVDKIQAEEKKLG